MNEQIEIDLKEMSDIFVKKKNELMKYAKKYIKTVNSSRKKNSKIINKDDPRIFPLMLEATIIGIEPKFEFVVSTTKPNLHQEEQCNRLNKLLNMYLLDEEE